MSKTLNETAIVNELTGDSLYFPRSQPDIHRETRDNQQRTPPTGAEPATPRASGEPPAPGEPVPQADVTQSTASPPPRPVPPAAEPSLDLDDMPFRKLTCLLTPAEHRALDLLKIELSDRLDGPVTKEHLVRCAIHYLVADYRKRGDASPILVPLKRKSGQW